MENAEHNLDVILAKSGRGGDSLVPALLDIQKAHGYLPEDMLRLLAERLGLPLAQVYSVAAFYKAFSLKPKGKHLVSVCLGTACHVRGAPNVVAELERLIGVKSGETSEDMEFSLDAVNCLGACALGPIVVMDGEYHGQMNPGKVRAIFEEKYAGYANRTEEARVGS